MGTIDKKKYSIEALLDFLKKYIFSLNLQVSVLKTLKYVLPLEIKIDIKAQHLLHKL